MNHRVQIIELLSRSLKDVQVNNQFVKEWLNNQQRKAGWRYEEFVNSRSSIDGRWCASIGIGYKMLPCCTVLVFIGQLSRERSFHSCRASAFHPSQILDEFFLTWMVSTVVLLLFIVAWRIESLSPVLRSCMQCRKGTWFGRLGRLLCSHFTKGSSSSFLSLCIDGYKEVKASCTLETDGWWLPAFSVLYSRPFSFEPSFIVDLGLKMKCVCI